MRLIARWLIAEGIEGGSLLAARLRRLVGDTAVLGKGRDLRAGDSPWRDRSAARRAADLFPSGAVFQIESEDGAAGGRAASRIAKNEEGSRNADRRPDPCRVPVRRADIQCRDEHLYFESHGSLEPA